MGRALHSTMQGIEDSLKAGGTQALPVLPVGMHAGIEA